MVARGVANPPFLTNAILVRIPLRLEKQPKACKSRKANLLFEVLPTPPTLPKKRQKKRQGITTSPLFYPLAKRKEVTFLITLKL